MSRQKLIAPTLCTLAGIGVLCALGFWQLHRLEWKTEIVRQLDAEFEKDISQIELDANDFQGDFDYKRGNIQGTYDFEKQIFIAPRPYKNLPGKHLYTPLRMRDGSYILVNRGWVPQTWNAADEDPAHKAAIQNGRIPGLLRKDLKRNPFTPDNNPAADKWYFPDAREVAAAKNIDNMHTPILVLEGGETEGEYPIPQGKRPEIFNDHLQYAIFWFTMAGVLAIIFALRFLRKK